MNAKILGPVLAIGSLIGGFALIMSGKLWGVLLFLVAVSIGIFSAVKARDAAGYRSDDFFHNGISGTGRQQSEVIKKDSQKK